MSCTPYNHFGVPSKYMTKGVITKKKKKAIMIADLKANL
jgi:hypothetical protein